MENEYSHKSREGIFVIFGYPAIHYKRGIKNLLPL